MGFKTFLLPFIGMAIWIIGALVGLVFIFASSGKVFIFYLGIGIMIFAFIIGQYLRHKFKAETGQILWHGRY